MAEQTIKGENGLVNSYPATKKGILSGGEPMGSAISQSTVNAQNHKTEAVNGSSEQFFSYSNSPEPRFGSSLVSR